MSVNSTSTLSPPSVNPSSFVELLCLFIEPSSSAFVAFTITNILLLLPISGLVLYHFLQRGRGRSSTSESHSDTFTYHLVTMEMTNVIACIICCCGIYMHKFSMIVAWYCLFVISWYGETFFHVVTCVEHYLAVVHPITYMSLRQEKGIRIRNIIVGFIWLFTFGGIIITAMQVSTTYMDVSLIGSSVVVISFCSLSVLWALLHPGPGEQDQRRLTQSKQRAFYTILIILGVLMVRCISNIAWSTFSILHGTVLRCDCLVVEVWCNIPSSLVLPLLFLQRAGKVL